jgi:hypothetical protein
MGLCGLEPAWDYRVDPDCAVANREALMKTVSPYLSAEALGLKESHQQALIGLASDLAAHRIPDDEWNFSRWTHCTCGHLQKRTGVDDKSEFGEKIFALFTVHWVPGFRAPSVVTQELAGQAVFNYLTLGEPRWDDVLRA